MQYASTHIGTSAAGWGDVYTQTMHRKDPI